MAGRAVIVISPGRSGSSLVAGLLAGHRVWVGECRGPDRWNKRGHFENIELRRRMLGRFGHDWLGPPPEPDRHWPGEVRRTIASQGYEDGHWLFKTGALYWKTWAPFEPVFVKVWREPDAIQRSYRRCGFLDGFSGDKLSQLIARQHQAMRQTAGPDITADQVAGGQAQAFLPALEALGLPLDKAIFEAFVNRDLWTR